MQSNENAYITIFCGCGIFLFGMFVLLDRALMAAGNMIIIAGFIMLLRTDVFYLLRPTNMLGVMLFTTGIISLLLRHVLLGCLLEFVGVFYIIKQSLPSLSSFLRWTFVKKLW